MRNELSDYEWTAIKPMLPYKPRGVRRVNDRRVLGGISGAPWRDLPETYGPRTTCYNRYVRWRRAGVWDRIMDALAAVVMMRRCWKARFKTETGRGHRYGLLPSERACLNVLPSVQVGGSAMTQSRVQAAAGLRQIAFGMRASRALYIAAKLDVADQLTMGPRTAEELSRNVKVDANALRRIMRALCSLGVFAESSTGEFSLNSTAELLRSDVPGSYRAAVLLSAGDVRWRCWSGLLDTVRVGGGGAERALGMEVFDFYSAHPEESEIHDQAMRAISATQVSAIVAAKDFAQAGVVVDVGGGTGELLAAVLVANPSVRGILFDLPHVVAHAQRVFVEKGVADRTRIVGGSFFESVPREGNTYLLKTVIHDWDDARATAILANCRTAMTLDDTLIIIERELPEVGTPLSGSEPFLLDLEMLVMTSGGRERTRSEFNKLLSDSHFEFVRVLPTGSPVSLFEARPV